MSKLINLKDLENVDCTKYNMMCGLEIHQQLNCNKLFSNRPCKIVPNEELNKEIIRKQRFALSESGDSDKAAKNEFLKNKIQKYKFNNEIASLVDLDEEPPTKPNKKALSVGIRISQMLNLNFFDKIQFMRKIIVDGSVVSGFQRTAMLGTNGKLETKFGIIEINGVNVEEDSCRAIERGDDYNIFSLDRQGIPLIEITTGPQIKTPSQAQECAKQIGNILRSFSETRRGLGTIRQDLNVSISGGSRVEIKGAQNLKLIPEIVEAEVKRQAIHLSIIEELNFRKINKENFSDFKIYDLSKIFNDTQSEIILKNLEGKNKKVLGIKLNKFKEILGHELNLGFRFATEISDRNKNLFPKIKGLFHSDELPKYGISIEEVENIRKELKLNEKDSFILIANEENYARNSLNYIFEIIKDLMSGVPEEVRQVDPKGNLTKFLRPMPGAARMYPETDVDLIQISKEKLNLESKQIPELYNEKIKRIATSWDCSEDKVNEFLDKFSENEISNLIKLTQKGATELYQLIFEIPKDIKKRDNIDTYDFKYELYLDILNSSKKNNLNQKILRDLLVSLYKDKIHESFNLEKYIEEKELLGIQIDESEIKNKIKEIISQNSGAPFGALMGKSMAAFQGKVDGKLISSILKKLI